VCRPLSEITSWGGANAYSQWVHCLSYKYLYEVSLSTPMKLATMLFTAISLAVLIVMPSCTANTRARNYGGTLHIELPAGAKLVSATWKGENLWYLTRPARDGETPEVLILRESSKIGLLEGKVVFTETAAEAQSRTK
jgi:hypothetical protein